ncbi:MAG TPA: adenylate/guanylate cyclase domain-containing protein [Syntrophales bacterium]|nr:adenylate/guanylate cyclase domain-containing protein [Syntrophales bacterium]
MNKPDNADTSLITSKELLKKTGISRATLNNYIKDGIIPRPLVRAADDLNLRVKRIGYFPQDVINRIEKIRRMKREGVSMESIIKELSEHTTKSDSRPELLSHREKIISELMKQRMPSLVSFCVLVAGLQDSSRICAELPPEEYFDLIRDIWKCMNQIFEKYYGTYGKQVGDGIVYYFFKDNDNSYIVNSIYCAIELRQKIKELDLEWKIRKGWLNDLYLNIGINEGQEFFGTISSAPNIEFTALGDSVNHAGRLSDLARYGAILTTKNLINRLSTGDRKKIRFGIRLKDHDREALVENIFSRVMDMLPLDDAKYSRFNDIATLAVTEILITSPRGELDTLTGISSNAACDA